MNTYSPTFKQWILFVSLFVLSLPAVTPRIYSSDEIQYFAFLRSLWFDHDLSFENEYRYFYDRGIARSDGFHETFLELRTATGHRINFGTIGCAILWSPFYAVGDLVARITGAPRDGFSARRVSRHQVELSAVRRSASSPTMVTLPHGRRATAGMSTVRTARSPSCGPGWRPGYI